MGTSTHKSWAKSESELLYSAHTVGPETYLEVMEGLLRRQGLAVAHHVGKDLDSGDLREYMFCFVVFF